MSMNQRHKWIVLLLALTCPILGCGDDDDDERDGGASVVSLNLDPSAIGSGSATIAAVKFSFSSDDVFDDDRNVALAIFLPNLLRYREGTAELKRIIDDRQVMPQVFSCGDGSSIIVFDLDEDDLVDVENPSGNADAELRFTADSTGLLGTDSVEASAANDSVIATCGGVFPVQAAAVFSIG